MYFSFFQSINRLLCVMIFSWLATASAKEKVNSISDDKKVLKRGSITEKSTSKSRGHLNGGSCKKGSKCLSTQIIFGGAVISIMSLGVLGILIARRSKQENKPPKEGENSGSAVKSLQDMILTIVQEGISSSPNDITTEDEDKLRALLLEGKKKESNESYAYSVNFIRRQMGNISLRSLLGVSLSLAKREKDPINIFSFGKIVYMGFDSRKQAYVEDEKKGINPIANSLSPEKSKEEAVTILQLGEK